MKTEKQLTIKIFKNALLSLLIYALPILLMLAWFYITGQRPWQPEKQSTFSYIYHK
jgi:hypothetical protein